jgi:hypothetical protein
MVIQDWDTTASQWLGKTAGLWPNKAICRTMAGLVCQPVIVYQYDASQIDANIDAMEIDMNFNAHHAERLVNPKVLVKQCN